MKRKVILLSEREFLDRKLASSVPFDFDGIDVVTFYSDGAAYNVTKLTVSYTSVPVAQVLTFDSYSQIQVEPKMESNLRVVGDHYDDDVADVEATEITILE